MSACLCANPARGGLVTCQHVAASGCAAQHRDGLALPTDAGPLPCPLLQDAVRGEFREVAKLLSDNGGKVYEVGAPRQRPALPGHFGSMRGCSGKSRGAHQANKVEPAQQEHAGPSREACWAAGAGQGSGLAACPSMLRASCSSSPCAAVHTACTRLAGDNLAAPCTSCMAVVPACGS